MHKKLTVYSSAKLNLYLNVGEKQIDGYHALETVFQSIDLYDKLEFILSAEPDKEKQEIKIIIEESEQSHLLQDPKSNLIYRAAKLFFRTLKDDSFHLTVKLTKRIPIAAGLAGGSGNAAATLYALNYLLNEPFKQEVLLSLARELGSDVPFSLLGGCMLGTGRGDQLTRITETSDLIFILILPPSDITLATKEVYETFDKLSLVSNLPNKVSIEKFVQLLITQGQDASKQMFNSLEESAVTLNYWVDKAKTAIDSKGYYSLVSGSGPTVFTIAPNEYQAISLLQKLQEEGFNAQCHRSISESLMVVSH
ncbi:MAG: 4-(cytidine 5'-diphospho)-2-C-methyl-D-erythritol kinase [Candidatus Caenarcaniphilales bacterium]|nr:4-(cytidine 5'-diphospho)-2-C-methyl-D-erythritol kinase [Candidatus Caenarcaniphilales bacterium]